MPDKHSAEDKVLLSGIAHRAMIERGMVPDFPAKVGTELEKISAVTNFDGADIRDLRDLPWCSIDNDDSLDLDQLTYAEATDGDATRIMVAIADVDALVRKGSALDEHAWQNTTSVYTASEIFSMLPVKLSTDLTSLNLLADRLAIVVEMTVAGDGNLTGSDLYRARVRNKAKLAYNSVAAWLEGKGPKPESIGSIEGLEKSIMLQDATAQSLGALRHLHGALDLETIQARPVFEGGILKKLEADDGNRAKDIIADFMIAVNGVTARYLESKKFPSLQRVVRTPKRWERIVELAAEHGAILPAEPDSKALEVFLTKVKTADPVSFPDLSLSIVKLLGRGEYVVHHPGESTLGHFGLAVRDYSHSTAPNRRYPDLVAQRLLKAAIAGLPSPYTKEELDELAKHCTEKEDAANKVERQVAKSAAALLLESRIGERFDAIVTGAGEKGTWVRLLQVPVEGRLSRGYEGMDVGVRLRVELLHTDVDRGFIDFGKIGGKK
ncbi:MAG: ribonuclease II [Candidatus Melainabacteria bacterium HGW-Melainabacteria-1]|nr:MAG: ribonuclease II [Candidatus Melainabacteria bacterium HGW-Melainabacteria-1]